MVLRALAATCLAVVLLGAARPLAVAPYATLGFEYVHHEIVIRATVDGAGPYAFLLDTGTNLSVVDTAVARKTRHRNRCRRNGGGFRELSTACRLAPWPSVHSTSSSRICPRRAKTSAFRSLEFIGANFFDGRSIRIDYPCHEAAIVSSQADAVSTATFKTTQWGWIDIADVWANGRRVHATIDTGNPGSPIVTKRGIQRLHLQDGRLQNLRIG